MLRRMSNWQRKRLSNFCYFYDDFLGSTYDTNSWSVRSGNVPSIQAGGVLRVRASAGTSTDIPQGDMAAFSVAGYARCLWRFKISSLTSIVGEIGLESDTTWGSHWMALNYDPANTPNGGNWHCKCQAGGALISTDSGVAANTNYHEFMLQCRPGALDYWIDGVLVATNVSNITAHSLQPYIFVTSSAGSTRDVLVDFVEVTGNRA